MAGRLNVTRTRERAFHPQGNQQVITVFPDVFTILRTSPEGDERILAMTNVTPRRIRVEIPVSESGARETHWRDLLSENEWVAEEGKLKVAMEPYDVIWLKALAESKG
jgi:sucrose phosphorylase